MNRDSRWHRDVTLLEMADKLDENALAEIREATSGPLRSGTYTRHLEYAERAFRLAAALRTRSTQEGDGNVRT